MTVVTERKNLSFDNTTCRDVLNRLADEFGVEYVVRDRTIAFYERVENATSLVFEQGRGKGLYTLQRQNVDTDNTVTGHTFTVARKIYRLATGKDWWSVSVPGNGIRINISLISRTGRSTRNWWNGRSISTT